MRRRSNRRKESLVPFSWSLLLIAVLHFAVWSLGVCDPSSQVFFAREIENCKGVDITQHITLNQPHNLHDAHQAQALLQFIQQQQQEQQEAAAQRHNELIRHLISKHRTRLSSSSSSYSPSSTAVTHLLHKEQHSSSSSSNSESEGAAPALL